MSLQIRTEGDVQDNELPYRTKVLSNGDIRVVGPEGYGRNFGKRKAEARKHAERLNRQAAQEEK